MDRHSWIPHVGEQLQTESETHNLRLAYVVRPLSCLAHVVIVRLYASTIRRLLVFFELMKSVATILRWLLSEMWLLFK